MDSELPVLVATDLDGTLLPDDLAISPRTRTVIEALAARGIPVIPATARQPLGVRPLDLGVEWVICSNGALVTNLRTGEVVAEASIAMPALEQALTRITEALPGAEFFAVGDAGNSFVATPGYPALAVEADHKRDPAQMMTVPLSELGTRPVNKLGVRVPGVDGRTLLSRVRSLQIPGVAPTNSGVAFVDLAPAGVNKAWGVQQLCRHLRLDPRRTLAFGDQLNDLELLESAGTAVAMPGSPPELLAMADRLAPSNNDDGVARVLESVYGLPPG
ncbi:HAD family hydrolase [Naumannella halotolerans]|uniref:HAD superfamily hydrolase (TIGR01484 family) n=1 Tax=Naumannella halotolerans TaxID=993414 RepID=A0A4R7J8S2_9ACTN|nr:HAD family hydrolase [Naumannella halotolerans]TDT32947.1 hypothetical protein CLV29_0538 [Naumannella halotolerans]